MNTDDDFAALLADYAAPVPDDGFADAVIARAGAADRRARQLARWRRGLSGGALFGTVLTAALMTGPIVPELSLDGLTWERLAEAAQNPVLLGAVALLPFAWLVLDPEGA